MTLLEAINKYVSWKMIKRKQATAYGYDGYLRHFSLFLRNPDVEDITLEQIEEYLHMCRAHGYKPNTLEKYGVAIKDIMKYLEERQYRVVKHTLVPIPQKEHNMPRVANEDDFVKIINAIPQDSKAYYHLRNKAILWLLHDSGCRVGELLSANIQNINFEKNAIQIKTEKGRNGFDFRNLFWYNDQTTKVLSEWIKKRKELLNSLKIEEKEALFISVNGGVCANGSSGRRMDIGAAGEMIRKYSKLAGLENNLNAHSFRHFLGRRLAERGMDGILISQVLGHNSTDSSRIYTNLYSDKLRVAFREKMAE